MRDICRFVKNVTGVDVLSKPKSRKRHVVDARFLYVKIAKTVNGISDDEIMDYINKDRTSIYNALKVYDDVLAPTMDRYVLSYLDKNPDVLLLYRRLDYLDESDIMRVNNLIREILISK